MVPNFPTTTIRLLALVIPSRSRRVPEVALAQPEPVDVTEFCWVHATPSAEVQICPVKVAATKMPFPNVTQVNPLAKVACPSHVVPLVEVTMPEPTATNRPLP